MSPGCGWRGERLFVDPGDTTPRPSIPIAGVARSQILDTRPSLFGRGLCIACRFGMNLGQLADDNRISMVLPCGKPSVSPGFLAQ